MLPRHVVDADELIYGRCFRNHSGTTSLAPAWLDLSKLRCPHALCRTRVDSHCAKGQMGHAAREQAEPEGSPGKPTGMRRGPRVPYPGTEVLDLEAIGFNLLLEDVALSYLLFQL